MDLGRKMSRKAFMESNHETKLDLKRLSKATGTIFTALRCRNDAPGPSNARQGLPKVDNGRCPVPHQLLELILDEFR